MALFGPDDKTVRENTAALKELTAAVKANTTVLGAVKVGLDRNTAAVDNNSNLLIRLLLALRALLFRIYTPGPLKLIQTGEPMADKITFDVQLPTLTDKDVVSRELTVKIGDADPTVTTVAKDQTAVVGLVGDQDAALSLSLVDIDDAGNRSQPSEFTGTLVDTFPPAKPGALGINITGEEEGE